MMDMETLYRDYFSVVYKYILSISRDPHTAEEITQETFFKALKKIDTYRGESSIHTWLCGIARNAYYDLLRKQTKRGELPEEYGESTASAEQDYLTGADAKAAHGILHQLAEPYKEVFSLRTFAGLPFSDIGDLFGKTESWARVTYHRARLMIREELER